MKTIRSEAFKAEQPWGSLLIAEMQGITTKLHWTDAPYEWHVNEGDEVFAVLHGVVEMRYVQDGEIQSARLQSGDIFYAAEGCEHVAHPEGEARILVIEKAGSP